MQHETNTKQTLFSGARRDGMITVGWVLLLLTVAILINSLVGLLPAHILKPDVTNSNTFRLSSTTVNWLQDDLQEPVTLYLICEGGSAGTENEIFLFLSRFAAVTDKVTLEVIDPAVSPEFIAAYGGEWPENLSVIVQSSKRYKLLTNSDLYYYYNEELSMTFTPTEYQAYCNQFMELIQQNADYQSVYLSFVEGTTPMFDGEVTNAMHFVTLDKISVLYTYTGKATALDTKLEANLLLNGYEMKTLLSIQSIPSDCDLLMIHTISSDLTEAEAAALKAYLGRGGKLFLTTHYQLGALPNLGSVLSTYGMSYAEKTNLVYEGNTDYFLSDSSYSYPYYILAHVARHEATGNFDGSFVAPFAHAITLTETNGVTLTPWLYTSESGYQVYADTTSETKPEYGTQVFGALAESGDTEILWLACASAATSDGNSMASGGNFSLLLSAVQWLSGSNNAGIAIDSATIPSGSISVTVGQFALWAVVIVLLLPLGTLVAGILVWYSRKRR